MATVSLAGLRIKDLLQPTVQTVTAAEALADGDVCVYDAIAETAAKLDVTTYVGDEDVVLAITDSALDGAVVIASSGTQFTNVTVTEGTVLFAKGDGLAGDSFSTDLSSTERIVTLGVGLGSEFIFIPVDTGIAKT